MFGASMKSINNAYAGLSGNYLFSEVARRVSAFKARRPETEVISLGIGDVSQPLAPAVISALHKAVDEMARPETFRGYGPEQGYAFLREAILRHDFLPRGVNVSADEIFISDGAKSDIGNFQELFGEDAVVALTDPVYPVYEDSNAMSGRAGTFRNGRWSRLVYLPCTRANGFQPELPETRPDVIYLCSPNNPTGTVLDRESLTSWVNYARQQECLILFDAAYESFIRDDSLPHSIYEIPGADEVVVSLYHTISPEALRPHREEIRALFAQNAALVFHNGDEGAQIAPAAVIGHHRPLPGPHLHKGLLGQFGHAAVDHSAAHLHLPRQLPFGGQLGAHRQLARQNHSPQLLDKQVL